MEPLYIAGTSPIHRLHPLTKMVLLVFATAIAYTLGVFGSLGVSLVMLLIAAQAGIVGTVLKRAFYLLLPILISLILIRGFLFPPSRTMLLYDAGWFTLWADGWLFLGRLWLRLFAVSLTLMLLVTTLHPADLSFALSQVGVPRSIGYIITVALQLIPDMTERANGILESQRSRGLETEGLFRRLTALPSLVGPLLVGALSDVQERAITLESRAFLTNGPKTSLRLLHDSGVQRAARWFLLMLSVVLVVGHFTFLRGAVL